MRSATLAITSFAIAYVCLSLQAYAQAPDSAARGATLYAQRCASCHSIETNKIGPRHTGVIGRKAGTEPGFNYSPALKAAGFTWTKEQVDKWLQGPSKLVPGVRMFFTVPQAEDRAAIIAYLETQK